MGEIFTVSGVYISEEPLPLEVAVGVLSDSLRVGDIVTLKGMGWQRDIGLPFRIPEAQKWVIVCPDLIPEGAD